MTENRPKKMAIIAGKGTLDQAYPPLILASTGAALDMEVQVFFTFYGLDIVHKKKLKKLKVPSLANPAINEVPTGKLISLATISVVAPAAK